MAAWSAGDPYLDDQRYDRQELQRSLVAEKRRMEDEDRERRRKEEDELIARQWEERSAKHGNQQIPRSKAMTPQYPTELEELDYPPLSQLRAGHNSTRTSPSRGGESRSSKRDKREIEDDLYNLSDDNLSVIAQDGNIRQAYDNITNPVKRESESTSAFNSRIDASLRHQKVNDRLLQRSQQPQDVDKKLRHEQKKLQLEQKHQDQLEQELKAKLESLASQRKLVDQGLTKVKAERKARKAKQENSADSMDAINVRRAEMSDQPTAQKHEPKASPAAAYSKEYTDWLKNIDILDRYRRADIEADGISGLKTREEREPFRGQKYAQKEGTILKEEPYVPRISQNTTRIRDRGGPGDDPSSSSSSAKSSLTPSATSRRSQRPKERKESPPERETPRPESKPRFGKPIDKVTYNVTSQVRPRSASRERSKSRDPDDPQWIYEPADLEYQDEIIRRLRDTIKDRVGTAVTYDPAVVKLLKPVPPDKYNGEDDIEVFENWVAALLQYFRISGLGGRVNDQLRVDLTGTNLKGLASDWFHAEVESWDREVVEWTFMDLICALYKRFIHQVTAQNATDKFYSVRYNKSEGALAFYNALFRNAARMVSRPDEYTFKRRFMFGLPHELVEKLYTSRRVTAEHTPLGRLLHEVKAMESAMQAADRHRRSRQQALIQLKSNTASTSNHPARQDKTVRFSSDTKSGAQPARSNTSRYPFNRGSTPRGSSGRFRPRSQSVDVRRGATPQGSGSNQNSSTNQKKPV